MHFANKSMQVKHKKSMSMENTFNHQMLQTRHGRETSKKLAVIQNRLDDLIYENYKKALALSINDQTTEAETAPLNTSIVGKSQNSKWRAQTSGSCIPKSTRDTFILTQNLNSKD